MASSENTGTLTAAGAIRNDARRNRERLLVAAAHAFGSGEPKVTLEAIAKEADVGIATLYRHFPTREALVEAVYRNESARLRLSAGELLASRTPDAALRAWMDRFADFVATKRGIADMLRFAVVPGELASSETTDGLTAAIQELLDAGAAAGSIRGDFSADDVLAGLVGIFLVAGGKAQRDRAERLLDLLTDGLRAPTRISSVCSREDDSSMNTE